MKPVRKAVRTFLFQGDKVMAIRYKNGNQKGYLDIPGGKIEDGRLVKKQLFENLEKKRVLLFLILNL